MLILTQIDAKITQILFCCTLLKNDAFSFLLDAKKNLFDFSANWRNFCVNFLRVINVDFDANWRKNNADLILFDFMQKWRILHINRIVMKSYRKMDAVEFSRKIVLFYLTLTTQMTHLVNLRSRFWKISSSPQKKEVKKSHRNIFFYCHKVISCFLIFIVDPSSLSHLQ